MIIKIYNVSFEVEGNDPFWRTVLEGTWEPETYPIMQKYLDKEHSYLDIGAWIGPTVLFGAQLAKECIAFEPDLVAAHALRLNLALNPGMERRVEVHHKAVVGENRPMAKIGSRGEYGNSMSSVLWKENQKTVPAISFATILQQHPDVNFIKMDIEGGEFEALSPGDLQAAGRPTLFLSLHAPWFENKKQYWEAIIPALAIYRNVYDTMGNKIALQDLGKIEGFHSVVATDL